MKEYLIRLLYCEMLGKDVPFGYIHAVKFTQHSSLLEKRVGYLAVSLLLHEDHELIYLLVNTIQRDLQSTNIVEVCMALTVVCVFFCFTEILAPSSCPNPNTCNNLTPLTLCPFA